MTRILSIETSTDLCSVSLSQDGKTVSYVESETPRSHASLTAVFVSQVLEKAGVEMKDCDAVCVSSGPGSFTGLRVGMSTAKGLCFGAGIKLLSVDTLTILARQAFEAILSGNATQAGVPASGVDFIVPMIDARRMEVYTAVHKADGVRLSEPCAKIIDGESFSDLLSKGKVLFIGDGAEKCRSVIQSPNAFFLQCCPNAGAMSCLAHQAFVTGDFKDVAYEEPFYLKDFQVTESKKKLF